MTLPNTIHSFLDEFGQALRLSGGRRRRVLDEARDHLLEATEQRIAAGMDPSGAELAAIEAFGDPVAVATRFDPGWVGRIRRTFWSAMDRFDRWHVAHTVAAPTVLVGPFVVLVALMWSPLAALGFIGPWMVLVWIGEHLKDRDEPGYRHRLWGWKQEHPKKFHTVTNLGAVSGFGLVIGLVFLAGLPPVSPWLVPSLAPFYPVLWILSMPRPYKAPRVSAA